MRCCRSREKMISNFLCLVALIAFSNAASLPSYIKPCLADADLSKCATKAANEVLPELLKGDKTLKLPNLLPYHLPEITITTAGDLKLKFTDCVLHGLDNVHIDNIAADLDKKHIEFEGTVSFLNLLAQYTIDGKILVLPITGSGKSNITMSNVKFKFIYDFNLVNEGGSEYMRTKDTKLIFEPDVTTYDLENLFNGDERLGKEMNKFLNENNKEVGKDLNSGYAEIVTTIITYILNNVIHSVPYDQIFVLP